MVEKQCIHIIFVRRVIRSSIITGMRQSSTKRGASPKNKVKKGRAKALPELRRPMGDINNTYKREAGKAARAKRVPRKPAAQKKKPKQRQQNTLEDLRRGGQRTLPSDAREVVEAYKPGTSTRSGNGKLPQAERELRKRLFDEAKADVKSSSSSIIPINSRSGNGPLALSAGSTINKNGTELILAQAQHHPTNYISVLTIKAGAIAPVTLEILPQPSRFQLPKTKLNDCASYGSMMVKLAADALGLVGDPGYKPKHAVRTRCHAELLVCITSKGDAKLLLK